MAKSKAKQAKVDVRAAEAEPLPIPIGFTRAHDHTERAIHGVFGGPGGGGIVMTPITERASMPGELPRPGLMRTAQATYHMSVQTAELVRDWLTTQIERMKEPAAPPAA